MEGIIRLSINQSDGLYFSIQPFAGSKNYYTINYPDGSIVFSDIFTRVTAQIMLSALCNYIIIRDNPDVDPKEIATLFLSELNELKPKTDRL